MCSKGCFLTEDEDLIVKSVRDLFNFVDLCNWVSRLWLTVTRTRVDDAFAVIFSVKYLIR